MTAMKMSGVFSIFRNASWAMIAVIIRERALPAAKALTSAPAEKNFSDALVNKTARISPSLRASSMAPASDLRNL